MRAVRVQELGSLDRGNIDEVDDPVAAPGEVVVEIHAAPVNFVDVLTMLGTYQFRPELPYTPGKGPAGVVRSLGPEVDRLVDGVDLGDRVLAMTEYGGLAEAVAVDHRQVHRLPDSLSFAGAAAMSLAFDTAWMALRDRARLAEGESVLVLGASGAVGTAAVQLARAMGAGTVLAGVRSTERLVASGLSRFVDATVDLSGHDLRQSIRDEVLGLTGGRGVDVVVDAVGGDAFDGAIRALAWRGRLVVVGFAGGRIATLRTNYVLLKNIEVSGLQISDYRRRMPQLVTDAFQEVFTFYEAGLVAPPRHRIMPLEEWATALRMIEDGKADRRLVLAPRP